MRRLLISTVGVLALLPAIRPAAAADLPVYKAPPAAASIWTGFYVGVNGGYSWGRWDSASRAPIFPSGSGFATTTSPHVDGWLGGVQAGYNWQLNPTWVVGLEGDIQITGERAKSNGTASLRFVEPGGDFNDVLTTTSNNEWKFPWFATLRGRIGLLADPTMLLYVTGGLAVGEFKFSTQASASLQRFGPGSTGTTPVGPAISVVGTPFSDSKTRVGGTIGAGIEKKFTPNWSAKVEYLYLDFDSQNFFVGTGSDTSVRLRDHVVRGGINYAFGPL